MENSNVIPEKEFNSVGDDAYFLTATNFENHFLKYEGKDPAGNDVYKLLEGPIGAAIWKLAAAHLFIEEMNGATVVTDWKQ